MCLEKCIKLQELCDDYFDAQIQRKVSPNLPYSVDYFDLEVQTVIEESCQMFEKEQIGPEGKQFLAELKLKLAHKFTLLRI